MVVVDAEIVAHGLRGPLGHVAQPENGALALRKLLQACTQHVPELRGVDVRALVTRGGACLAFRCHFDGGVVTWRLAAARAVHVGDLVLQDADRVRLQRGIPAEAVGRREHGGERFLRSVLRGMTVTEATAGISHEAAAQLAEAFGVEVMQGHGALREGRDSMGASLPAKDHANLTRAGRFVQFAVPRRCCKVHRGDADKCGWRNTGAVRLHLPVMLNNILIVEDQRDLAELAALHLGEIAREVTVCGDGPSALRQVQQQAPDLVVLDLGLPGLDGLEVCRRLRAMPRYIPVLMLTARGSDAERVLGLETGADDYLVKPFNVLELVARAKAIVRRMEGLARSEAQAETITCGELVIDPVRRQVNVGERAIDLTAKEFDLLLHFARHPGRVFSREQLLDSVWGGAHAGYAHTVNSHINRLRAKLETDPANPRYLRTVWGVGYKFADDLPRTRAG